MSYTRIHPLKVSAVQGGGDVAIAVVAFILLERWRIPPLAAVEFCVGAALFQARVAA